jgi:hypothetical protein
MLREAEMTSTPDPDNILFELREGVRVESEHIGTLTKLDPTLLKRAEQAIKDIRSEPHVWDLADRMAFLESLTDTRDLLVRQREFKLFLLAQDNILPKPENATPQETLFCAQLAGKIRDFRQVVKE